MYYIYNNRQYNGNYSNNCQNIFIYINLTSARSIYYLNTGYEKAFI